VADTGKDYRPSAQRRISEQLPNWAANGIAGLAVVAAMLVGSANLRSPLSWVAAVSIAISESRQGDADPALSARLEAHRDLPVRASDPTRLHQAA
jgi:hypothetical protein